jgi:hypothetical protein
MHAASRSLATWGGVLTGVGVFFGVVGLLSSAYGILALAMHSFDGTGADAVAGIMVLAVCFAPLAVAIGLVVLGVLLLRRAARLRELKSLVYGRESVTTSELAARTQRTERDVRTLLARAERYRAAWPIVPR